VDSVKILAAQNPGADLVYLMGSDSLNRLPGWYRPADLVAGLHYIGVMRRIGETPDLPALDRLVPGLAEKVRYLDAPRVDISASDIRLRARHGQPFEYLLPPAVYRYIREHHLYHS
jgi:nicotinate-nucleotide adenylyltransferase